MRLNLTPPPWATHWISDLTDWKHQPWPLPRIAQGIELPDDVYLEFAWLDEQGQPRRDPHGEPALNPWWDYGSAIKGPAYVPDELNVSEHSPRPKPLGTLTRHSLDSQFMRGKRRFMLYSPPGFEHHQLPLLYVHDGLSYEYHGGLLVVLDRLVAANQARPVRLVLTVPVERETEYPFNETYLEFVQHELVLAVEAVANGDGTRLILGASLGGLAATLLALRAPDTFGTVLAQSGAFITSPENKRDHRHGTEWVRQQLEVIPYLPIRFHLMCGALEWLTDANRRLRDTLLARQYAVTYFELNAGHNWVLWRNGLARLLRTALPVA